jgi:HSP20 family molecular chaperone IbpA
MYGKFSRLVPLRWTVSIQDATAELDNGILVVIFPKIEDRRGVEFRIPIKDSNSEQSPERRKQGQT